MTTYEDVGDPLVRMASRLPTFIIGGAPKCGTTALWAFLSQHPEVYMSEVKEPRFFTRSDTLDGGVIRPGPRRAPNFDRGLNWYQNLFSTELAIRGEASTRYLAAPDSASLIREYVPDVRLIFILRDPVARLYSHYWQDRKEGVRLPGFEHLVSDGHAALEYYVLNSSYRRNLSRFFAVFPAEQILVLLHDDFRRDPQLVFKSVCKHLNASVIPVPTTAEREHNESAAPRFRGLATLALQLQHARIMNHLPPGLKRRLGRVRKAAVSLNLRAEPYIPLSPDLRSQLVGRFSEDVTYVEELLGVSLTSWRTVSSDDDAAIATEYVL